MDCVELDHLCFPEQFPPEKLRSRTRALLADAAKKFPTHCKEKQLVVGREREAWRKRKALWIQGSNLEWIGSVQPGKRADLGKGL